MIRIRMIFTTHVIQKIDTSQYLIEVSSIDIPKSAFSIRFYVFKPRKSSFFIGNTNH